MKSKISPEVRGQISIINDKMDKLADRIAKNNADNLRTLCEIAALLQNIEDDHTETNQILLKGE
jgi:enoyl-CoA hydratase/carnithine racemase